jgi:hypothetical protein
LRRFPEHLAGRARRCFEELLDRAASHMHLLWDRGEDTPVASTAPVVGRKYSPRRPLAKPRKRRTPRCAFFGRETIPVTSRACRGSTRSDP